MLKGDVWSVFAARDAVFGASQQQQQQLLLGQRAQLVAALLSGPVHACVGRLQQQSLSLCFTDQQALMPVQQDNDVTRYLVEQLRHLTAAARHWLDLLNDLLAKVACYQLDTAQLTLPVVLRHCTYCVRFVTTYCSTYCVPDLVGLIASTIPAQPMVCHDLFWPDRSL
jgi:hypothetical protein